MVLHHYSEIAPESLSYIREEKQKNCPTHKQQSVKDCRTTKPAQCSPGKFHCMRKNALLLQQEQRTVFTYTSNTGERAVRMILVKMVRMNRLIYVKRQN